MDSSARIWELWAPRVARLFLAIQFGIAAYFKLTAFSGQVASASAAGVPLPTLAVALALILEVAGVLALLTGYYLRPIAAALAGYVMLLAVIFYHDWSSMMMFGLFVSHLGLTAALLYVSTFGASKTAPAA